MTSLLVKYNLTLELEKNRLIYIFDIGVSIFFFLLCTLHITVMYPDQLNLNQKIFKTTEYIHPCPDVIAAT